MRFWSKYPIALHYYNIQPPNRVELSHDKLIVVALVGPISCSMSFGCYVGVAGAGPGGG